MKELLHLLFQSIVVFIKLHPIAEVRENRIFRSTTSRNIYMRVICILISMSIVHIPFYISFPYPVVISLQPYTNIALNWK